MQRHARQARLAEVGAEGQAKIARSAVRVPFDGFAADTAARYLAGAGVARLTVRDAAVADAARAIDPAVDVCVDARMAAEDDGGVELPLRDPTALELARGALFALRRLRAVIDETT